MIRRWMVATAAILAALAATGAASAAERFVAAWAASAHGPYPVGNPTAQPELKLAFPDPAAGARDQSLRMVVTPGIWGKQARIRLSNAFGKRDVTFDGAFVGLHLASGAVMAGTNRRVTFGAKDSVTVKPGQSVVSDPVALTFVKRTADPLLAGRRLAVSFHVAGESGPMTWHAKALATSYLTAPGAGAKGGEEGEGAFPFSTTSWYFLDAVEMLAPATTRVVVAFGDSITDGTASTINGDDRWPDVLARRLRAEYGQLWVVVNAGIGGNRIAGPANYYDSPIGGGPSALERMKRDVISLPGVASVVWLEGINDFGSGAALEPVVQGVRDGVAALRAGIPKLRVVMGTLTGARNSTATHGTAEVEAKRQAFNNFVRNAGIFDGVVDFDAATFDAATGEMKAEMQPNSSTGGPGDKLHPNRAGYAAMAAAIDLKLITGK